MGRFIKLFSLVTMLLMAFEASAQERVKVSGIVTDKHEGTPLIGATITWGDGQGITTDVDGSYSITVESGAKITFLYLGYEPYEWRAPGDVTEITHNAELSWSSHIYDEVVVVAYGTRTKGTIAGSVSTVRSEKLESVPAAGFDQALQGQSPGLMVLSNSGEPSKAATFQIRGTNSINSGTAPLFILDGVPISSSDFNAISPSDIESVSLPASSDVDGGKPEPEPMSPGLVMCTRSTSPLLFMRKSPVLFK